MHETWQRNRFHQDSMQLRSLPWRKYRNRKKQLNCFIHERKLNTKRYISRVQQTTKASVARGLTSFLLEQIYYSVRLEREGLIKRMGGRLRFKAEVITASLRLERDGQVMHAARETHRIGGEIIAAVFTCNMGIALTCSSSSLIRSNDTAICSLMFWKYTRVITAVIQFHSGLTSSSSILRTCCTYL